MTIDLKKLYEQDDDFKKFVHQVLIKSVENSDDFIDTIAPLYAMYSAGLSADVMEGIIIANNQIKRALE